MPCSCPPDEVRCPGCPRTATCKYWIPSNSSKFYRCSDRNQYGLCKRPKTDCPNCPLYKPSSSLVGRPRVVDELDRMEADDPYWNDPRVWGEKVDPVESRKDTQRRYKQRKKDEDPDFGKNSPEYIRKYMRGYRAKSKGKKSSK